ncbi:MAG: PspC domain-containing protein [Bacteroidota bacterium]
MKKTISINISGILFHIEEDGYDTLRKYLDAINRHFSSYKDNHEIISDIETRIAEIFLSNLKNNKQVITAENVDKLIEKMGTIADFASISEADPEDLEEQAQSKDDFYKYVTPPNQENRGYKKLMRIEPKKILGGVCAGIAHYFAIDPLWPRLIALLLLFSGQFNKTFIGNDFWIFDEFRFHLSFGLFTVIAYIVLWVILPVSYDIEEDKNIKKLYRNPDDKALGGVASGLAAYFGIEVIWTRLAFVILTLAGGSGVLLYLILWIITPVAMSITERIRMKGGEITLDNIDSTLKENQNPLPPKPESTGRKILMAPFRVLGQVIEAVGNALGPLGKLLLNILRVLFGLFVFFLGLVLTIAPLISIAVYFGIFNSEDYRILLDNFPLEIFSNLVPLWLIIGASFIIIIPGIILLLLGLSVLAQKNLIGGRFGLVALGLWLLCIGVSAFQIPKIVAQFKQENRHIVEEVLPVSEGIMVLKLNPISEEATFNHIKLRLLGTEDSLVSIEKKFFSRGRTKSEALENAKKLAYEVELADSVVLFNEGFELQNTDMFRAQELEVLMNIPYDRPFIMERSLLEIIRGTIYTNGYRNSDISQRSIWVFNQNGLLCLTCPPPADSEEEENELSENQPLTEEERIDSLSRAKFKELFD